MKPEAPSVFHDDALVQELDEEIAVLRQVSLTDSTDPDDVAERLEYVGIKTIWEARCLLRKFREPLGRLSVLLSGKAYDGSVQRGICLRLLCLLLLVTSKNTSENAMLDYLEWFGIGPSAGREQQAQETWNACLEALKPAAADVGSNAGPPS